MKTQGTTSSARPDSPSIEDREKAIEQQLDSIEAMLAECRQLVEELALDEPIPFVLVTDRTAG